MEKIQRIYFWYQILPKMLSFFFLRKWQKKKTFLVKKKLWQAKKKFWIKNVKIAL